MDSSFIVNSRHFTSIQGAIHVSDSVPLYSVFKKRALGEEGQEKEREALELKWLRDKYITIVVNK